MAVALVTIERVENLPQSSWLWDTKVKGFGVRRQRKDPTYYLKFKTPAGQWKFHPIGRHGLGEWTPETARNEAIRLKARFATDAIRQQSVMPPKPFQPSRLWPSDTRPSMPSTIRSQAPAGFSAACGNFISCRRWGA